MTTIKKVWLTPQADVDLYSLSLESARGHPDYYRINVRELAFPGKNTETRHTVVLGLFDFEDLGIIHKAIDNILNLDALELLGLTEVDTDTPERYQPSCIRCKDNIQREPHFGIGIEHQPNSFGMIHGPFPDLQQALEELGEGDNCYILRLTGTEDTKLYKWNHDEDVWIRVKE